MSDSGSVQRVSRSSSHHVGGGGNPNASGVYALNASRLDASMSIVSGTSNHNSPKRYSTANKGVEGAKQPPVPKKKVSPPCCTAPLAVVFGLACVVMAMVFTVITVVSTLSFTNEVDSSVKSTLGTAMQGAMKYVTDPLLKSQQYATQLKVMVESGPLKLGCDDSITTYPGNTSTQNFLYEIGMYALQRKDIQNVYQSRLSKRFMNPSGSGPAGICCLVAAQQQYAHIYVNNTQQIAYYTNGSFFENIASQVPSKTPLNIDITQLAVLRGAITLGGNKSAWFSDSINIVAAGLSEPANKYTYFLHIDDPADPTSVWAIGIDHNMMDLKNLLLQATPPITVGNSDIKPSQVSGAHTTLYDLNEKLLMASTHPSVPVAKAYGVLFPQGQSPSDSVNAAFQEAMSRCGATGCTDAVVTIGSSTVHTAYRINVPSAALHLMMVSSVPRDYFFADADRTFAITLGLSIGSCTLVVCGCILLLVMIYRPLNSLKENMLLAAELHNDRVEHTHTYLRDIAHVSSVFDQMNQQLLVARSFVPEAVLLGKTEDSQEDAGDDDEEGSVRTGISPASSHNLSSQARSKLINTKGGDDNTIHTSNSSNGGMAKLFNVAEKRVGILSLNLVGFHNLCAPERHLTRAHKINELSTNLLSLAVACAHGERGVMDSFHGDHFTLTYNASRAVAGPLAAAVRSANSFIAQVHENPLFANAGGVAAGAASSRAHVGTFGIDGYRRLSVVGEAYRTATALQLASDQLLRMGAGHVREGCMVEEASLKELGSCAFHLQLVGCLQSAQHRVSVTNGGGGDKRPPNVYYAVDSALHSTQAANDADGEWLYELDAIAASDPFQESNQVMVALMLGDLPLCEQLIGAHDQAQANLSRSVSSAVAPVRSFNESLTLKADSCPTWQLLKMNVLHYKDAAEAAAAASTTSAGPIPALSQRYPLPWVLFQQ